MQKITLEFATILENKICTARNVYDANKACGGKGRLGKTKAINGVKLLSFANDIYDNTELRQKFIDLINQGKPYKEIISYFAEKSYTINDSHCTALRKACDIEFIENTKSLIVNDVKLYCDEIKLAGNEEDKLEFIKMVKSGRKGVEISECFLKKGTC